MQTANPRHRFQTSSVWQLMHRGRLVGWHRSRFRRLTVQLHVRPHRVVKLTILLKQPRQMSLSGRNDVVQQLFLHGAVESFHHCTAAKIQNPPFRATQTSISMETERPQKGGFSLSLPGLRLVSYLVAPVIRSPAPTPPSLQNPAT